MYKKEDLWRYIRTDKNWDTNIYKNDVNICTLFQGSSVILTWPIKNTSQKFYFTQIFRLWKENLKNREAICRFSLFSKKIANRMTFCLLLSLSFFFLFLSAYKAARYIRHLLHLTVHIAWAVYFLSFLDALLISWMMRNLCFSKEKTICVFTTRFSSVHCLTYTCLAEHNSGRNLRKYFSNCRKAFR